MPARPGRREESRTEDELFLWPRACGNRDRRRTGCEPRRPSTRKPMLAMEKLSMTAKGVMIPGHAELAGHVAHGLQNSLQHIDVIFSDGDQQSQRRADIESARDYTSPRRRSRAGFAAGPESRRLSPKRVRVPTKPKQITPNELRTNVGSAGFFLQSSEIRYAQSCRCSRFRR